MVKLTIRLVVFLAFVAFGRCIPLSCPTSEDLAPCSCNRMAFGLSVTCENFQDSKLLVKAMKILRDYFVEKVILHGLHLTEVLPDDVFDGLEISQLRVENSVLKFSEPAFSGLDNSLHLLNVAQNSEIVKSSNQFDIAPLNQLTQLNIKKNPIDVVKNDWFNGKIPSVEEIVLEEDEINAIESRAFADLSHLKIISISDNRLKKIERSMFPRPANALMRIDLR